MFAQSDNIKIFLMSGCVIIAGAAGAYAEPQPGDLFREYTYANVEGDAGGSIRVGGKKGVSYPDRGSDFDYVNAWISFPHEVDFEHAVRAEVVVEKILSHNGTHGLAIQWNDSEWLSLPSPDAIPLPRRNYYHHTCITVPVPLDVLAEGKESNRFRLRVNPEQDWGWPQHLVCGVHLRVFYDPDQKKHVAGRISHPVAGSEIGRKVPLAVDIADRLRRVNRVDYLAHYEGVNWAGDGVYRRWHYFYYHGRLAHHLDSSVVAPFKRTWDTSWVPDQEQPVQIAARIVDDTGLIYWTPAVTDLRMVRPGFSVELCKPTGVAENWVTRNKAYEETVKIHGDLSQAIAARLAWSSWSPGYMNGLFVNGTKVLQVEGPRYRYYDHMVKVKDLSVLKSGSNTIGTGKTPLHDGKMVHGMEVNWPGIQLIVQYEK